MEILTKQQIEGIELHEKERIERCKRILVKYAKKPKEKTEEEIKQEKINNWKNGKR